MAAEDASAYLFLSLLQARVGGSLGSRLGDRPVESLLCDATPDLARDLRLTERATRALSKLREGGMPGGHSYRMRARSMTSMMRSTCPVWSR